MKTPTRRAPVATGAQYPYKTIAKRPEGRFALACRQKVQGRALPPTAQVIDA